MVNIRLKKLITYLKISNKEFAEIITISPNALSHYLNGRRNISNNIIAKIHKNTGCNLNWLLTGEGEMFLTEKKLDDVEKKFLVEIECLKKEIDGIQTMLQQVELAKRETETENKKLSADLRQKAERIISLQDRLLKLQES
jgi:transcriptional regulator with XRE-family HTH domain